MNMGLFPCKSTGNCSRCGRCCVIRETYSFDSEQDIKYRQELYDTYGIIYIYPLKRYTITVTEKEAKSLLREARKIGVFLHIKPKKIFYDVDESRFFVYDYFIDHDVCPFLEGKNHCIIYSKRPKICRLFPKQMDVEKEFKEIVSAMQVRDEIPFRHLISMAKKELDKDLSL